MTSEQIAARRKLLFDLLAAFEGQKSATNVANTELNRARRAGDSRLIPLVAAAQKTVLALNDYKPLLLAELDYTDTLIPDAPPAPAGNWLARSTAPGVVLATDFGTDEEVLPHRFANANTAELLQERMSRVTRHMDNGVPCLRIASIEGAGGDQQGQAWRRRFKPISEWPKDTDGFGTDPFWIQFGVKIPASRLIPFREGAGSWKFAIVANMSVTNPWGAGSQSSNLISHVLTNSPLKGINFPIIYIHNNSYPNGKPYTGFQPGMISGSDIDMSPGWDRGAEFADVHTRYCSYRFPERGCPQWPIDEWVFFNFKIHIRTFGGTDGNECALHWAKEGAKEWTLLREHRNYLAGSSPQWPNGFNAIWLTPYETNRNAPGGVDSYILYRHLIVSTQEPALPS